MLNFHDFVASCRHVDCLQTEFNDLVFEPNTPGDVYPDGLYIADGENPIELCREYFAGSPEYLQAVLYAFYLANSDVSEWKNQQLHTFIVSMIDIGGYDQFARALIAADGFSHADYCDTNQLALDAVDMGDDITSEHPQWDEFNEKIDNLFSDANGYLQA